MTRYLTEDEYLDLRASGRIKDYSNARGETFALLHVTLPEPGGAFVCASHVAVITELVPTTRTSYGVTIYACDPAQWAREHRHPDYFYNEDGTN